MIYDDLPITHGDVPVRYVSLPQGHHQKSDQLPWNLIKSYKIQLDLIKSR